MSLISIPYIFQPGTTIASAQVNADFAAIVGVVNGNLDGTNFSSVFTHLNTSTKGSATFAGGLTFNWASPATVPFDNSAVYSATFDTPFPTACLGVFCQVTENTQNQNHAYTVTTYIIPSSVTTTGFNMTAMGAPNGTVGTINWFAFGY